MTEDAELLYAHLREVAQTADTVLGLVSKPTPAHLRRIQDIRSDVDRLEAGLVAVLAAQGYTWKAMADSLGVTRQSVNGRLQKRASRWVDSVKSPVDSSPTGLAVAVSAALKRVVRDLEDRVSTLRHLRLANLDQLPALPPPPAYSTAEIDTRRRTSPSQSPR